MQKKKNYLGSTWSWSSFASQYGQHKAEKSAEKHARKSKKKPHLGQPVLRRGELLRLAIERRKAGKHAEKHARNSKKECKRIPTSVCQSSVVVNSCALRTGMVELRGTT